MKLLEALREKLLMMRRNQRTVASTAENSRTSFAIMAEVATDLEMKAKYQVALNVIGLISDECRSIAAKADEHLRKDEITADELVDLGNAYSELPPRWRQ